MHIHEEVMINSLNFLWIHKMMYIWCRNRSADNLYGYSAAEALGKDVIELLADPEDSAAISNIVHRVSKGESWTGQIPVKNKRGDRFLAVATNTPFYDDDGSLIGIICVSHDSRPFIEAQAAASEMSDLETSSSFSRAKTTVAEKLGLDQQQPLQAAIASKISNLVGILVFFKCMILLISCATY